MPSPFSIIRDKVQQRHKIGSGAFASRSVQGSTSKQNGAALIVALLVASLVAVIAMRVGNSYLLTFRRASNVITADQATQFLLSAESFAGQRLIADDKQATQPGANGQAPMSSDIDHLGEPWAQEYPPLPIGNALLAADPIIDLLGRININSLRDSSGSTQTNAKVQKTVSQRIFIRLLQTLDIPNMDVQSATALCETIIDWLDADDNPVGIDSAESTYYENLDYPYKAANRDMQSVSELRLVKGMTAEIYRLLEPHISVLSSGINVINFNTATENVLRSLGDGNSLIPIDKQQVVDYLELGSQEFGKTIADFKSDPPWNSLHEDVQALLIEKSEFYQLTGYVKLGELTLPMRSVLHVSQQGGKHTVQVLSRSTNSL